MVSQNSFQGMTRSAITTKLYRQVNWVEIQAAGVFLSNEDKDVLRKSHEALDVLLDNPTETRKLVGVLLHIADACTYDTQVQMYTFTRF